MNKFAFVGAMVLACAVDAATIKCSTLTVELDESQKGAVARLVTAHGAELAPATGVTSLFKLKLTRTDDFTKSEEVSSSQAKSCTFEKTADGVKIVYGGFEKDCIESVTCTVRGVGESVRWGIAAHVGFGWALEETTYPRVPVAPVLGSSSGDDRFVHGTAKGGIVYSPGEKKEGWNASARMPGSLAAQFATIYDDRAGIYFAAEDGEAHGKMIGAERTRDAVVLRTSRLGFDKGAVVQAYDVVTAGFEGTPGDPCTWHDAADVYKKWAHRQFWTTQHFRDRKDVPQWMRDAPAMVRFGRSWLEKPDTIRDWMKNYWQKHFMKAPLVMAYWGWEKRGYWVTPDYFPVVPGNEEFAKLMNDMKALDGHGFPWPSGYHWTTSYNKRADGSFVWDDRERFKQYERHAVFNRDGKRYVRTPSWLRGGDCACMCAGDPWTIDWWNNDICLPLAKMGCEMIQVDQVVGGAFPQCFAKWHPHEPGNGKWKSEVFLKQLATMREVMRTVEKDAVVAVEEPCEYFNHLVGIQDYRDCESPADEWASVFNYVYHEYLPCFQSNPRRGVWQAYSAAEGQMPFFTPSMSDLGLDRCALRNGSFETANEEGVPSGWEKLSGYNGEVWRGRCFIDKETKRDGGQSVRLESTKDENAVQVSQNIAVDAVAFHKPGMKYRLSAWLKTKHSKVQNTVNYCFLGSKARGGRLAFPKPEEGWKFVASEFTPPADGDATLRIMMHVAGDAVVWADGMKVEAISPDGVARDVIFEAGKSANDEFMRNWISLYHGEGRDWLAHGRMVKPPRVVCASTPYEASLYDGWVKQKGRKPVVFCAAYESLDGRRAVMLVNSTNAKQTVVLFEKGTRQLLTLNPNELRLLKK